MKSLITIHKRVEHLQNVALSVYGLSYDEIVDCRHPYQVECKKLCVWLAISEGMPLKGAAKTVGLKNHTTAISHREAIDFLIESDKDFNKIVEYIKGYGEPHFTPDLVTSEKMVVVSEKHSEKKVGALSSRNPRPARFSDLSRMPLQR